jgi:hypothetical protein
MSGNEGGLDESVALTGVTCHSVVSFFVELLTIPLAHWADRTTTATLLLF